MQCRIFNESTGNYLYSRRVGGVDRILRVAGFQILSVKKFNRTTYMRGWRKKNPEREVWTSMLRRCFNPRNDNYRWYGAKGIKVLYTSFEEFFQDVGKRPTNKYSIDRINNLGNYEKGNCRWATVLQQVLNRECHKTRQSSAERTRRWRERKRLAEKAH